MVCKIGYYMQVCNLKARRWHPNFVHCMEAKFPVLGAPILLSFLIGYEQ